jgi:multimeric flavodoxin WrbA
MKILLISAGTKKEGATERALYETECALKKKNVSYDIFRLFTNSVATCQGCGACAKSGICIHNDEASRLIEITKGYDGYIFFTPVHYGGASGTLKSALARLFFSSKKELEYKPAAAIAASRRGGNVTALEEITRFFSFASMPIISGNYPGIIHGTTYDEAGRDLEGLQTLRSIVDNMVWLIRCINKGKSVGINHPTPEGKIKTNYIK